MQQLLIPTPVQVLLLPFHYAHRRTLTHSQQEEVIGALPYIKHKDAATAAAAVRGIPDRHT